MKLTPTFTTGKMKMMFNILLGCSQQMSEVVHDTYNKNEEINIKDMLARFTTDVISSCAFGLESNSCKNPDEEFRKYGKTVLDFSTYEVLRNSISTVLPDLCRALGVILVKPHVAKFFYNTIKNTVDYREKNNIYRKDFLQMLIDMKNHNVNNNNEKKQEVGMTLNEMAAEAFAFYVGGFETSSSTMTFAFIEMALNQDVQQRARENVREVLDRHNGEISYEALQEMTYVQQVIDETLRKYPIVPLIVRQCVKDYKIENTDTIIDKGTRLFIPTYAIHRDPDNFPEPEQFDPDRFSPENKRDIKPFTYLPFGDGPRNCIGLRFGLMQSKLGIATVLKDFKFTLNEKTKMPMEFNHHNFVLEPQVDSIPTASQGTIFSKPCTYPKFHEEEVKRQINDMLNNSKLGGP
ncbi:hypothetical protein ILUMI_22519 [Ignelater luminosus]|uniref:Cytochrome P450 n=1 Tax=Ignelater luminosus TaxID=2038154 RepID=A0A8K0G0G3_IGNLU|nr:hypothetical protein ILUMI_22519 [Ignelater luminosus]